MLDVETTGLGKDDRIAEIAMLAVGFDGFPEERFETLVSPQRAMNTHASRVNGLRDEDLLGAPTFAELAGDIAAFLAGSCIVAHNASFDTRMLAAEFARVGCRMTPGQPIDTYRATGMRLEAALEYYGIRFTNLHRAMSDVQATAELLLKVASRLSPGRALEISPEPRALATRLQPRWAASSRDARAAGAPRSPQAKPATIRAAERSRVDGRAGAAPPASSTVLRPVVVGQLESAEGVRARPGERQKEIQTMEVSEKVDFIAAADLAEMTVSGLFVDVPAPDDDGEVYVVVRGELTGMTALPGDAILSCIISDSEGRIVGKDENILLADSYLGFEIFEFEEYTRMQGGLGRIRLVLKSL